MKNDKRKAHAIIQPEDYELAQIERVIHAVKLEKGNKLEMQIWKLEIRHLMTLENLGYGSFMEKQPNFEAHNNLKDILYEHLFNRMTLIYRLGKDYFKNSFNLFMH